MTGLVDLVVHLQLMVRKWSLAAPTVGQHLEAFVNETLVMKFLECPQHTFGVVLIKGLVVIVEVDPASLASHIGAPILGVLQH